MALNHTPPNKAAVPGFWDLPLDVKEISKGDLKVAPSPVGITLLENALSLESCDYLVSLFASANIEAPVSVTGLQDLSGYGIGSVRTTGWSKEIARMLSDIIIPELPILKCDAYTSTDWWQSKPNEPMHLTWKPVAISPLLRFMKYKKDGEHFAHYDAGYIYPDSDHRTLKSVVIYLSTNKSGATRFIEDNQKDIPINKREHSDWDRRVAPSEVLFESYPVKGKILIFDHRLCHDVSLYDGAEGDRIIIRGDVIYEKYANPD